jgi:iron complex transport system ATP-binding protein
VLELRSVSCRYGDQFALREINVLIEDRELVGLIGPNGSGKTTLIRAVTKIMKPVHGKVFLEKQPIDALSFKELAQRVAVVGRLGDFDLKVRVEELVLLGRIPYRQGFALLEKRTDLDIAREAMDLTGILKLKDRMVESLSSGERQLVFIARAVAQKPKLLLLDEPTSHLDITHQIRVMDLIKGLNREKKLTVLVVLHDLNLASQYCDRLLLLDKGTLRKDGTPKDVLTHQIIEEVYKTIVLVRENPVSAKPYIFPVSEEDRRRM